MKRKPAKKLKSIYDLTPDPQNANQGTKRGKESIETSLKRFGAGRSVLVDRNGVIIAGNKTIENATALGMEVVIVPSDGSKVVAIQRTDLDLTDAKARELAIADNRAAELNLEWNPATLQNLAGDLELSPFFTDSELERLGVKTGEEQPEAPDPKVDRAEELQKKWRTAKGQIWEIPSKSVEGGTHRLMCGDSADADQVRRLFAGATAALLATDPPYGVAFGVESGPESAKRFTAMESDSADGGKLQKFLEAVFAAAVEHLRPDAAWYLWHAQLTQGFFAAAAAAAAALLIHRQIIWVKSHFILGHGDYHWQHELCFYGWRQGHRARWYGDRAQSTLWEVQNPRAHDAHPTQKPVELFVRPMQFNTEPGEICYEPFSGSGTQICAGEQTGRLVYAMEIEPKYVAVALERASDMDLRPRLSHGRKKAKADPA